MDMSPMEVLQAGPRACDCDVVAAYGRGCLGCMGMVSQLGASPPESRA